MTMPIRRWTFPLVAVFAFGQEAAPFPEEAPPPWKPGWELTLRGDQLTTPIGTGEAFKRVGLQLRLRWSWDLDQFKVVVGTRSALGSDGNLNNPPRWDQQPSNGSQLDVAQGMAAWTSQGAFAALNVGLQENGLLVSQALWDRDLRFLGVGGTAGMRTGGGLPLEAGFRGAAGRVRNILGGRMDLAAGQVVLKLDMGPWTWTAHAGHWSLTWDPGEERRFRLPGHSATLRQNLALDAAGASARWHGLLPIETRWFWSRNRENQETSEEVQALVGSRERTYWPQLSLTWQRLASTGTLYPVNGDEWWLYRGARGHRIDLSLPLPGHWLASLIYLNQRGYHEDYQVTRTMVVLVKRF